MKPTPKKRAPRKKIRACGALVVNVWNVLAEAVERGVARGRRRAEKHCDGPPPAHALDCAVEEEVMNELHEVFIYEVPPR